MPAALRKTLIGMSTSFLIIFVYMFFDPSLRDFFYAVILRIYLAAAAIVVTFVFKKGVISLATIAWHRIFFIGGLALMKRFWINFAKKNAIKHIVEPLLPPLKKWFAVHTQWFKKQPKWAQFSETSVGAGLVVGVGYFFGAVTYVWSLIMKVLTGQLQNFFLSVLGMITGAFQFIWSKIQPWFDILLITAAIEMIEKIPGVRAIFRGTRKMKDAVVNTKDKTIRSIVHKPVSSMARAIENHAEKKKQKIEEKEEMLPLCDNK